MVKFLRPAFAVFYFSKEKTMSKLIAVSGRISQKMGDDLAVCAEELSLPKSQIVREAVVEWLECWKDDRVDMESFLRRVKSKKSSKCVAVSGRIPKEAGADLAACMAEFSISKSSIVCWAVAEWLEDWLADKEDEAEILARSKEKPISSEEMDRRLEMWWRRDAKKKQVSGAKLGKRAAVGRG